MADQNASAYPWATLLAVALTLVGAVVLVIGQSDLNFDQYTNFALAGWAALAVGRGLAAKPVRLEGSSFAQTLNTIPWSTVVIGIIAAAGAVVLVIGESSLAFDEYFQKVLLAAGALGIGRGIAALKKDVITKAPTDDLGSEFSEAEGEEVYTEPEFDESIPTDEPLPEGAVVGKAGERA